MQVHELKLRQPWFDAVMEGRKNFEIRDADRDFAVGDHIYLKEWERGPWDDPEQAEKFGRFTGKWILVSIIYITDYHQPPNQVVIGFERIAST